MKLILLIPMFFVFQSYGQLQVKETSTDYTVGEVKVAGSVSARLVRTIDDTGDTTYILLYRNARYETLSDYVSITFSEDGNTLSDLYSIMKSVIHDDKYKDKEAKTEIKLGNTDVTLSRMRTMGQNYVSIWCSDGFCYISEKQLNRLFGKAK